MSESEKPPLDTVRKQIMDLKTKRARQINIEESIDELHEIQNGVLCRKISDKKYKDNK